MNTLRSFIVASSLLAGACAHPQKPSVEFPGPSEMDELQILAVKDRVTMNCGYVAFAPARKKDVGDNPDAAVFLNVLNPRLSVFIQHLAPSIELILRNVVCRSGSHIDGPCPLGGE